MLEVLTPEEILARWESVHFRLSDKWRKVFLNRPELEFIKTYNRSWVAEAISRERYLEIVLRELRDKEASESALSLGELKDGVRPESYVQHGVALYSVALCGACGGSFDGIYSNCKCFG